MAVLRSFVAAAVLATALHHAPAAEATCMSAPIGPRVLTPDVEATREGGGLVIQTHAFLDARTPRRPAYELVVKGKKLAPVIVKLAPGLELHALPAGVTAGELRDGKRVVAKLRASSASRALLPAPALGEIATLVELSTEPGEHTSSLTTVALSSTPPPSAIALVIADEKGTPLTFGLVSKDGKALVVYEHHRCEELPPGMRIPIPGTRVIAYWIDAHGRASVRSQPLVVAKATAPS